MVDSIIFLFLITFFILLFAYVMYLIYSAIPLKQRRIDHRQTFKYIKNKHILFEKMKDLTQCTKHSDLSATMLDIRTALSFFQQHELTVFDRPPEQIKTSVSTYATMILEDMYQDNKAPIVDKYREELELLEEYVNDSEEEKQERAKRRDVYHKKMQDKEVIKNIHRKQHITDYLDEETQRKLKKIKSNERLFHIS